MEKAPDGCLQYHSGISGGLKSFNYDGIGCFSNDHICDPDNLESCEFVAGLYILYQLWYCVVLGSWGLIVTGKIR